MRIHKHFFKSIALTTLFSIGLAAYGFTQDESTFDDPNKQEPVIVSTSPSSGENNVDLNKTIEITFNVEMDEESINDNTLKLQATSSDHMYEEEREMMDSQIRDRSEMNSSDNNWQDAKNGVEGTISYSNKVASFTPNEELKEGTKYTFIVTSDVKSADNVALKEKQKWSFTTKGNSSLGNLDNQNDEYSSVKSGMSNNMSETQDQTWARYASSNDETSNANKTKNKTDKTKMIELGKASYFVILAKEDVNNESGSKINGRVGDSSQEKNNKRNQDAQKQNQDQRNKTSSTEAIEGLESTYSDVSMHQSDEGVTNHNTKSFHHDPALKPGVHTWDNSIEITSDVTLSGSEDDVWVFKTDEDLTMSENTKITLADGAQANNVYWYVEGETSIGKNAEFEGIILSKDEIELEEGAKVNGRLFSQASVTLDDNTINEPKSNEPKSMKGSDNQSGNQNNRSAMNNRSNMDMNNVRSTMDMNDNRSNMVETEPLNPDEVTDEHLTMLSEISKAGQSIQEEAQQKIQAVIEETDMEYSRFEEVMMSQQNPQMAGQLELTEEEKQIIQQVQPQLMQIHQEAQQQYIQAIEEAGIDLQTFQQVAQAIQAHPEVKQRFDAINSEEGEEDNEN